MRLHHGFAGISALVEGLGGAVKHHIIRLGLSGALSAALALPGIAQTAGRDHIAELLAQTAPQPSAERSGKSETKPSLEADRAGAVTPEPADPRTGDPAFEQARALMQAVDAILRDTAENRANAKTLPAKSDFIVSPMWTETREDREAKIGGLLDSALSIVTDVPVVEVQKRIEGYRRNIRSLEDTVVSLKEKQLLAPKDGMLPGMWTDTIDSLTKSIGEANKRITENRDAITKAKADVHDGLVASGLTLSPGQIDLLLDSVLSGDLVRLVATFNAAKLIDGQLAKLMGATGDNMNASRKYFAMHAALFAMLVHAQDATVEKIDTQYVPKLDAILKDITAAKSKTADLMRAENRPDQRRALDANRESQKLAEEAAKVYRRYLSQQREQIAKARSRATHDLRIADNTYETVEASFQLRNLMRDSSASFEALQKLEAPTFDQIFQNEELRREFENLTRKLDAPSS
jgi:hypothetical protein